MGSSVVNDIESRLCAWHIVSALPSLSSPFYCSIGEFDEGADRSGVVLHRCAHDQESMD